MIFAEDLIVPLKQYHDECSLSCILGNILIYWNMNHHSEIHLELCPAIGFPPGNCTTGGRIIPLKTLDKKEPVGNLQPDVF